MNQLATLSKTPIAKPIRMIAAMRSGLDLMLAKLEPEAEGCYSISSRVAPSAAQRGALERRHEIVKAAIQAGGPHAIRAKIALLVGILPAPITDNSDPELIIAAYQSALADLPSWAVDEACDAAMRGKVGAYGGRYRPAPGELHVYAENQIIALIQERRELDKVISARVYEETDTTQEDRAAMIARVRAAVAGLAENARKPTPSERARMKGDQPLDAWDRKAGVPDFRDQAAGRSGAQKRLDAMTYANAPLTLSPSALVTFPERMRPREAEDAA